MKDSMVNSMDNNRDPVFCDDQSYKAKVEELRLSAHAAVAYILRLVREKHINLYIWTIRWVLICVPCPVLE